MEDAAERGKVSGSDGSRTLTTLSSVMTYDLRNDVRRLTAHQRRCKDSSQAYSWTSHTMLILSRVLAMLSFVSDTIAEALAAALIRAALLNRRRSRNQSPELLHNATSRHSAYQVKQLSMREAGPSYYDWKLAARYTPREPPELDDDPMLTELLPPQASAAHSNCKIRHRVIGCCRVRFFSNN